MVLRSLLPALAALALSAADASAQFEFAGIPWGTESYETSQRLRTMGYELRGADQDGDLVFRGPDGEQLVARMSEGGLVQVQREWSGDPARLPARFSHLADSLRAALGEPHATAGNGASWNRGEASMRLWLRPAAPQLDSTLFAFHTGPRSAAEDVRRQELLGDLALIESTGGPMDSVAAGGWAPADSTDRWQRYVDTARIVPLGEARYDVRLRDAWTDVRRLENGLAYDAAVTEAELDCRELGLRPRRTIHLYHGMSALPLDFVETLPESSREWTRPAPGSRAETSLRAVCEVVARQG